MTLLETDALTIGYDHPLIGPIDMTIEAGTFLLVEGPNGSGKTSLFETLLGMLPPLEGTYEWAVPRGELRYVPQTRTLDVLLPATVEDVMATGFQRGGGWASVRRTASDEALDEALDLVEMTDFRDHLFRELSEGQKQLVLLARAFLGDPSVVLLDEPAASMDPERQQRAIEFLGRQSVECGRTIFMIAHGSETARELSDSTLRIDHSGGVQVEHTE